jgi:hypothetical protein
MRKAAIKEQTVRSETCRICDRVEFGQVVELGSGRWRHGHCSIGSEEWREYYQRLSRTERNKLKELYACFYTN